MNYTRILKFGCTGNDVKYMQECLISIGFSCGKTGTDGNFGGNTENAVKKYQKTHKDVFGKQLSIDGKIGEKTWYAIERDYKNNVSGEKYTRLLKKGMSGEDVRYMKNCLLELKYYSSKIEKITNNSFGSDTYDAVVSYQKKNNLVVDGIIGEKTWESIKESFKNKIENTDIKYTRVLKLKDSGEDVRYMKDLLFKLNYYSSNVKKITNSTFGNDTEDAVYLYQKSNKDINGKQLSIDGKIGEKTWYAIERDYKNNTIAPEETETQTVGLLDKYTHISSDKRKKIEQDLSTVSEIRKKIVLEILDYAYDKDIKGDVRALYLFGANLYDKNLKINYADKAEIDALAKRNPQYFNGGRKEWMKEQVERDPKLPASDCSGMEVGYMRKYELVSPGFDTTANNLCSNSYSTEISKSALEPGDWVGKSGHIGTYVGGGFVVEFAGGAYGAQITTVNERICYDFLKKKNVKLSNWTKFRKPSFY